MNGKHDEKNLVPSEKKLVDGKKEVPLGTKLSEKIQLLLDDMNGLDEGAASNYYFQEILRDMFSLMCHHRYGVLYNVLKKFI